DNRRRIVEALLALTARDGWQAVTLSSLAAETGLALSEIYVHFPSRQAILAAFFDGIDSNVLANTPKAILNEPPRDRLFDILMRRFDTLNEHKDAIAAIVRGTCNDPLMILCGAPRFMQSIAAMLEAAGLSSAGCAGTVKANGLAVIYLNAFRVWLRDDTQDMSKTMATLDKSLRQADRLAAMLFIRRSA
ncbi:MAG: TetR/AcrR family transcriptional regulator, partial [Rhodospirillales bacterium]